MTIVLLSVYMAFCILNYCFFSNHMQKETDKAFVWFFYIHIASGPILTLRVLFRKIRNYQIKRQKRNEILLAIQKDLPDLLRNYHIKIEK